MMSLATDGKTLYVGNVGGESISIVDLDLGKVVDNVVFRRFRVTARPT
jgi:hypothetical protein